MTKSGKFLIIILSIISLSNLYAQSQEDLLDDAYSEKSTKKLERFFENWRKEKLPISDSEYFKLNDEQKDVYDVFYEFYNPLDMKRMKLDDWEYTLYHNAKYVVMPKKIKYGFTKTVDEREFFEEKVKTELADDSIYLRKILADSNWQRSLFTMEVYGLNAFGKDSIINFRPRVKFDNAKTLYFSKKYSRIVSEFLGDEFVPLGQNGIMQPAYSTGESEDREKFLGNFIL